MTLAGCAGGAKDPATPTDATAPTPGSTTPGTPDPLGLIPVLGVDIDNGTAPVHVNFTLGALNTTGPANWTLASELAGVPTQLATGATLPATASHVFTDAGQHNITFTVSRNGTSKVADSIITVLAAGPGLPSDLVAKTVFEGSFAEDEIDAVHSHPFEVLPGALAITIMGDWNGGIPASDNWGYPNDLDLFLKNPSGGQAAASEMLGFEFMHHEGELAAGTWTLDVLAYDLASQADYAFNVLVWYTQPTRETATGSTLGDADVPGDDPYQHTFEVPADAQAVVTYLTWTSAASSTPCNSATTRTNDLDLSVTFGGAEVFGSGYFHSCEFGFVESGPDGKALAKGGTWTVDVVAFLSPSADYKVEFLYA